MRFRVYQLRRRGRRVPWREVANGRSYIGDLRTERVRHGDTNYEVAVLFPEAEPVKRRVIPDLYEPVLVSMSPSAFQLRGYERVESADGDYGVVQEWLCEMP